METPYSNLTVEDSAGSRGENLECCTPILWPGLEHVTETFIKTLLTRLLAATYREATLLNLFALRKACLTKILTFAAEAFSKEKNILDVVVPVHGKVHVFGDTHGDFHSLLEALSRAGLPHDNNFLCFAGDFVDRGCWGVEIIVLVFLLKLWKPDCVFIVRGNHETTGCIARYGFELEVKRKYDDKTFDVFTKAFREMPCAAVLRILPESLNSSATLTTKASKQQRRRSRRRPKAALLTETAPIGEGWRAIPAVGERRIIVMHGGLFRTWRGKKGMEVGNLVDLMDGNRRLDDPHENIFEDVIWSDPQTDRRDVCYNFLRGAGILYGEGAVEAFLKRNGLCGMVRAHEGPDMRERRSGMNDMLEGFSVDMETAAGFVVTVFTAADYPPDKSRGNKGAFATFYGKGLMRNQILPEFTQFEKGEAPEKHELFYKSAEADGPTPRQSFS